MTWHRNYLHFGSATLFFVCMAIFCLVQFPKGESVERSRNEPLTRYYTRPATAEEEQARILRVLQESGGNKAEAARRLGMSRTTLWKRLSQA